MDKYAVAKEVHPIAATSHGLAAGENRNGVAIFRGIPYGADTSGENRFKEPKEAEDWEGTRDCYTSNGPVCPQLGPGSISQPSVPYWTGKKTEKFKTETEVKSENCLVVDVVTPGLDDGKRAVIVYIHGGGYMTGSGSLVLGADEWAAEQNIVLVGINHRLNVFGYLYLGDLDPAYKSSGMAGVLDLVLALKWVQKNIAAFGGDPGKVTIMGESGGCMKVSTLMDMEECRGLFRGAIGESGSSPTAAISREQAAEQTRRIMERLGVSTIQELQQVPAEKFEEFGDLSFHLGPVADEIHLKYNASGKFRKSVIDVPLLVGSSEDEMAVFLNNETQLSFGWDELPARLRQNGPSLLPAVIPEDKMAEIIAVFKRTDRKQNSAEHLYSKIISMSSMLGGGAYYHAVCASGNNASPVYHYMIRYDAPYEQDLSKHFAWHTAELPLIMRIVAYPEECQKMSDFYSESWANFIKYQDPSTDTVKWPAFDTATRQVMIIDDICRTEKDPMREMREIIGDRYKFSL